MEYGHEEVGSLQLTQLLEHDCYYKEFTMSTYLALLRGRIILVQPRSCYRVLFTEVPVESFRGLNVRFGAA